jgi:methionine--tRNA ligase beta chain
MESISFNQFQKIKIRIGTVIEAEEIEKSDKLIKLVFDFGDEKRQIIAGIKKYVDDLEGLIGKQMPVLVNLEPKKMKSLGLESQGMLLAAVEDDKPVFLFPEKAVKPGSIVS